MKKNEKIVEDTALKVVVFATGHPEILPVIEATKAALKVAKKCKITVRAKRPRARSRKRRQRGLGSKLLRGY